MGIKEIKYNSLSPGIKEYLNKRGINDQEGLNKFINPDIKYLTAPGPESMEVARHINSYIKNGKSIFIWGDEDVDGFTSTILLYEGLKNINANVEWIIPSRQKEGYGLNKRGLQTLRNKNADLVVTVDTGITCYEEVEFAKSIGLHVIITDHHEPRNPLPRTYIVNPKITDIGFKYLAGVGVALKFFLSIMKEIFSLDFSNVINTFQDSIVFAMIGTVSDRVPRIDENRIILVEGIKALHKSKRPAFIVLSEQEKEVEESIRPLLSGRQGETIQFFLSKDLAEAKRIYSELNEKMNTWQSLAEDVFQNIKTEILKGYYAVYKPGIKQEFLGTCASKARELTGMPVFVLSDGQGEIIGEGRGPEGFNLLDVLEEAKDMLISYGGHKPACGFKLKKERLRGFLSIANKMIDKYKPQIHYDSIIEKEDINAENLRLISMMRPFGKGNEPPVFILKNAQIIPYGDNRKIKGAKYNFEFSPPLPPAGIYDIYIYSDGEKFNVLRWEIPV